MLKTFESFNGKFLRKGDKCRLLYPIKCGIDQDQEIELTPDDVLVLQSKRRNTFSGNFKYIFSCKEKIPHHYVELYGSEFEPTEDKNNELDPYGEENWNNVNMERYLDIVKKMRYTVKEVTENGELIGIILTKRGTNFKIVDLDTGKIEIYMGSNYLNRITLPNDGNSWELRKALSEAIEKLKIINRGIGYSFGN
mgnify:CR=1 FL=1